MVEKVDFSKRLKAVIEERAIRQSELCEKTGIGKSAMSQYLSGAFKPKQQNLYKLARALEVSEAWLMGYDVPMERYEISSNEKETFYFQMNDDSMIGAHIPPGARVLIQRGGHIKNQQIIACMVDSAIQLRRFNKMDGHVVLTPENSNYTPAIFSEDEFENKDITILGIAKQVIIDL
ncbi:helix-turn-helix domain-containing protein [Anaerovorax odorimutans]|uniref:Helix-turn-helix domain-containing protein n=1 Tax=Anaerovorax odorimutans TaxID=109327 RepID=A0ABT1RT42_9FIRM|nr:XRE family transcriptional regulator [Anaerovorax odorimutans]MCQ4638352.1 helix-turn-helix domain-containing protein [Anaerovorax odorimutans]